MSWFSRLLGRSQANDVPEQDHGFALPATSPAPADAPQAQPDLPAFRPSSGRLMLRGGMDADDARASIRAAFSPSQPVNNRAMFAGRRALLRDLIVAVEDQRLHFVLYGDRGIGKTSILRILTGLAADAGYLVASISGSESLTFADFARRVAARIPLLYHADYAPGSPEIEEGKTLADTLPQGAIDVSAFGEQLAKLENAQLLVILDEFDRVEARAFRAAIAELIKTLSDNAAPAQLVIAGVASDLSALIAQIPSIRRNVLGVMVPNMSDAEVREMLDRAEHASALRFMPQARELITIASAGLPYLVGLVAQHAGFITTARGALDVTESDVREAIARARGELSGRIAKRTLFAIERVAESGHIMDLGKVAFAAMRGGGLFAREVLSPELERVPEAFGGDAPLLVPAAGDPQQRWQFSDDGSASYVWFTALTAE